MIYFSHERFDIDLLINLKVSSYENISRSFYLSFFINKECQKTNIWSQELKFWDAMFLKIGCDQISMTLENVTGYLMKQGMNSVLPSPGGCNILPRTTPGNFKLPDSSYLRNSGRKAFVHSNDSVSRFMPLRSICFHLPTP